MVSDPNLYVVKRLTIYSGESNQLSHVGTKGSQRGFTLVEVLVVVVILSIFAGMMSLSVGGSESRENRAFYEHFIDSLQYVRLLSAERMQPMGLSLKTDGQGQVTPVIVALDDPFISYKSSPSHLRAQTKNAMELTAMSSAEQKSPTWQVESSVTLPKLPDRVNITVSPLARSATDPSRSGRVLQPWFEGQEVPQVVWFGTGAASPVSIEIAHDSRPIGEVIVVEPNGSIRIGQSP